MAGADQLDLIEIACFECGKAFDVCIRDYRDSATAATGARSWVTGPASTKQGGGIRARRTDESDIAGASRPCATAA